MVRAVRWADILVFDNGVVTLSLLVLLYLTSCYSFAITYFECPRVGNFRLKTVRFVLSVQNLNSTIFVRANTFKGK